MIFAKKLKYVENIKNNSVAFKVLKERVGESEKEIKKIK